MRRSTKWLLAGASAGAAAALTTGYGLAIRPWHLRWGATREEVAAAMPFDELIPDPNYFATRAVTIAATPDEVWPFVIDRSALPSGTVIRRLEEKRAVVFAPPEIEAEATWTVVLRPEGNATRLISRNRARFVPRLSSILRYLLVDPAQFVVERKWMLGVKERAEALAERLREPEPAAPQQELAAEPKATPEPQLAATEA